MISRPALTTTPKIKGAPRRKREAAKAEVVKEKGRVRVVAGKVRDLLPGAAPGAQAVPGALAVPEALAAPDLRLEVPPEMEGETMSAVILCKGSARGRIASSSIRLHAGTSRRDIAAKKTATSCMALLKVILPGSLLLAAVTAEGVPKRKSLRVNRRAKTNLVVLLAASRKRIKIIKSA